MSAAALLAAKPDADRRGHRPVAGRQPLPLRDLPAHPRARIRSRSPDGGDEAMSATSRSRAATFLAALGRRRRAASRSGVRLVPAAGGGGRPEARRPACSSRSAPTASSSIVCSALRDGPGHPQLAARPDRRRAGRRLGAACAIVQGDARRALRRPEHRRLAQRARPLDADARGRGAARARCWSPRPPRAGACPPRGWWRATTQVHDPATGKRARLRRAGRRRRRAARARRRRRVVAAARDAERQARRHRAAARRRPGLSSPARPSSAPTCGCRACSPRSSRGRRSWAARSRASTTRAALAVPGVRQDRARCRHWTPPAASSRSAASRSSPTTPGPRCAGRAALVIEWDDGPNAAYDSAAYREALHARRARAGHGVPQRSATWTRRSPARRGWSRPSTTSRTSPTSPMEPPAAVARVDGRPLRGLGADAEPAGRAGGSRQGARARRRRRSRSTSRSSAAASAASPSPTSSSRRRSSRARWARPVRVQWTREDDIAPRLLPRRQHAAPRGRPRRRGQGRGVAPPHRVARRSARRSTARPTACRGLAGPGRPRPAARHPQRPRRELRGAPRTCASAGCARSTTSTTRSRCRASSPSSPPRAAATRGTMLLEVARPAAHR